MAYTHFVLLVLVSWAESAHLIYSKLDYCCNGSYCLFKSDVAESTNSMKVLYAVKNNNKLCIVSLYKGA